MLRATRLGVFVAAGLLAFAAAAGAPPPDWPRVAAVDTITIRTADREGKPQERTIWLLVVDGHGYIRAGGSSRWDAQIDTHPDVSVEIEGVWYELRATRIPEGPLYDSVMQGMREKYGLSDALIGVIRGIGGAPRILRLDPRAGIPMG